MTVGLTIGRYQPFHKGHLTVVEEISESVDEIVICIGSAQVSHEPDDPFTAGERVAMVQRALLDNEIDKFFYIIPVEDISRNAAWVSHVEALTPPFDEVYSRNPLVVRLFKEAGYGVEKAPLYRREKFSGTEIRRRMLRGEEWRHLVPEGVADTVDEVDGVRRLRDLARSDERGKLEEV